VSIPRRIRNQNLTDMLPMQARIIERPERSLRNSALIEDVHACIYAGAFQHSHIADGRHVAE